MAEKKPRAPLTPMQLESALAGLIGYAAAADLLGITKQAVSKRADWIKREMGGIKTPLGWLFDPQKVRQYEPSRGRPAEVRRQTAPFPPM